MFNTLCSFFPSAPKNIYYTVLFDVVIILTCLASLILCTRSVSTGVQLQFVSVSDFKLRNTHTHTLQRCTLIRGVPLFHTTPALP